MHSNLCSVCGQPHDRNARYCAPCHAAYMREWRKTHPLTGLAKIKATARAIAGMNYRRGVITRKPCAQFADRANVGGKVDQAFALTGDVAQTSKEEQSCHPPVTDMWRAVAGARSRSM